MPRRKTPATPRPDASPVPTAPLLVAPRPRWEYHTYTTNDGVFYLDALGLQGWELVAIYPVGDALHAPIYYAVFKRQADV